VLNLALALCSIHTVGACRSTDRSVTTAVYHHRRDDQKCDCRLQPCATNGLFTEDVVQLLQQPWPPGVDGADPPCQYLRQLASLDQCGNDRLWSGAREPNRQLSKGWTDDRILRSQHPGSAGNCGTGATVDLSDSVNASNLQMVGTIRANAAQREADIRSDLRLASKLSDAVPVETRLVS